MKGFRNKENERGLILIYASNNAHGWVNYILKWQEVNELCKIEVAKKEFCTILRNLADEIEKKYPEYLPSDFEPIMAPAKCLCGYSWEAFFPDGYNPQLDKSHRIECPQCKKQTAWFNDPDNEQTTAEKD